MLYSPDLLHFCKAAATAAKPAPSFVSCKGYQATVSVVAALDMQVWQVLLDLPGLLTVRDDVHATVRLYLLMTVKWSASCYKGHLGLIRGNTNGHLCVPDP